MQIRRTLKSDIEEILDLYQKARGFMVQNGNPTQWDKNYPSKSLLENDIANNNSFVCVEDNDIVGTFMFKIGDDPDYKEIYQGKWLNYEDYGAIHRIASGNGKKGVASFCLNWCFQQIRNIRIDTHKDNLPMQNLLKKNGYEYCGIIYIENGDERIAFHKIEK
ncbi:GNAT family N-acetyltransferase [Clostridium sp. DL1XJH146]